MRAKLSGGRLPIGVVWVAKTETMGRLQDFI
jgi:hypothetical protein